LQVESYFYSGLKDQKYTVFYIIFIFC